MRFRWCCGVVGKTIRGRKEEGRGRRDRWTNDCEVRIIVGCCFLFVFSFMDERAFLLVESFWRERKMVRGVRFECIYLRRGYHFDLIDKAGV